MAGQQRDQRRDRHPPGDEDGTGYRAGRCWAGLRATPGTGMRDERGAEATSSADAGQLLADLHRHGAPGADWRAHDQQAWVLVDHLTDERGVSAELVVA